MLKIGCSDVFCKALFRAKYTDFSDFEDQVWQLIHSCWQLMTKNQHFGWRSKPLEIGGSDVFYKDLFRVQ